jgi:UTP--glucose-1-phosphate uridylyltransferase
MPTVPKITKAVIPAAGIGTRFLPWTKSMPKEMLPIIDRPVIQYIVEECVDAGIEQIIIVTAWHKRAIEDYFDHLPELEWRLEQIGKLDKLASVKKLTQACTFIYLRQQGPYGNATPAKEAHQVIGDQPFVYLWGDQLIGAQPSRLQQCLSVYSKYGKSVISAIEVPQDEVYQYGIGRVKHLQDNVYQLQEIVEKPSLDQAPSNLTVSGAYIFNPDIFPILENLKPGRGGEYWLVDAINQQAREGKTLACKIKDGTFYDTGNKWSYHKTLIDFIFADPDIGAKIKDYTRQKLESETKP